MQRNARTRKCFNFIFCLIGERSRNSKRLRAGRSQAMNLYKSMVLQMSALDKTAVQRYATSARRAWAMLSSPEVPVSLIPCIHAREPAGFAQGECFGVQRSDVRASEVRGARKGGLGGVVQGLTGEQSRGAQPAQAHEETLV